MVNLSFFEDIADKAGLLIPTVYLPIVEECTAPHLSQPIPEHVAFLNEKIRSVPDDIGEILRALRRRIKNDDPRVRAHTIKVLEALVRNGSPVFHNEMADHKGLLREIENTATSSSGTESWIWAKKEARQMILNLSLWFMNHPNPNCHIFTTMVTDVKEVSGPSTFKGIQADQSVSLQLPATHTRRRQPNAPTTTTSQKIQNRAPTPGPPKKRPPPSNKLDRVVQAIPIDLPNESSISAMLDTCATLAEYLPNAEVDPQTGAFVRDDVLVSFCNKVQKDHSYLALLLSSDIDLIDRDVIRSLLDSHAAILQQVQQGRRPVADGGGAASSPGTTTSAEATQQHQDPFAGVYRPRTAATADEGLESSARSLPKESTADPTAKPETAGEDIDLDDVLAVQASIDASMQDPPAPEAPSLDALFDDHPPVPSVSAASKEESAKKSIVVPADEDFKEDKPAAEADDFDDFLEKELGG